MRKRLVVVVVRVVACCLTEAVMATMIGSQLEAEESMRGMA